MRSPPHIQQIFRGVDNRAAGFTKKVQGFTLVELVAVLVIVGIVAALGSGFIVNTVNIYDDVQTRSKLVNRGRVVIEQMSRQLRSALPNSVRVSTSGNCVEFMPLLAGARYLTSVPDTENAAPTTSAIATEPFIYNSGSAQHISVAALSADEIYGSCSPNGRVSAGALSPGVVNTSVPLATAHRFLRNSVNRRVFIADDPRRFCLFGTTIFEYSNYGLLAGISDTDPGGDAAIMATNASTDTQAFLLSVGSQDLNTSLLIDLVFSRNNERVSLNQQVLIRNVP